MGPGCDEGCEAGRKCQRLTVKIVRVLLPHLDRLE